MHWEENKMWKCVFAERSVGHVQSLLAAQGGHRVLCLLCLHHNVASSFYSVQLGLKAAATASAHLTT